MARSRLVKITSDDRSKLGAWVYGWLIVGVLGLRSSEDRTEYLDTEGLITELGNNTLVSVVRTSLVTMESYSVM